MEEEGAVVGEEAAQAEEEALVREEGGRKWERGPACVRERETTASI